ncbi:hypothetical protein [Ekhidna sp.]|uniref:hypothetical protein n=1 Tax=Ekhidna sp. TaxID=2608089 RepID=UPI003C7DC75D
MKALLSYPFSIYAIAAVASVCIMIIIDYILGAEAEHLNAWVIVNRLIGNKTTIGDSLAIQHFGLVGATFIMLAINTVFGAVLIQLIKLFIRLVHS